MTRFERKNRTDINYKGQGGLGDIFDDAMKGTWYITDDEYDFILEHASDEELDLILPNEKSTLSDLKKGIRYVNDMLVKYNELEK